MKMNSNTRSTSSSTCSFLCRFSTVLLFCLAVDRKTTSSCEAFTFEIRPWLFLLGAIGMVGWTLLSRAYQIADVAAVAPFEYAYLPMAAALGFLVFDEVPTWNTLVGMALIIVSGVYIGYREIVNARNSIKPTTEASFAPGNPGVVPETQEADPNLQQ